MTKYYCTHGRGLFDFVKNELINFNIEDFIEGKVSFSTSKDLKELCDELKTIERLFLCILFYKLSSNQLNKDFIINLINSINFDFKSNEFWLVLRNFGLETSFENNSKKIRKQIKYRIDCKFTGKWKKEETFKKNLIENVSNRLNKLEPSLEIDLNEPNFIITCHLTDLCLSIGVPVSKQPLSCRDYIKNIGLRSTICSCMIQLIEFDNCFTILDPFCGKSTILAELFKLKNKIFFSVSSDTDYEQLKISKENLENFNRFDLILSNLCPVSILPYKNNLFDLIISDLPFGKSHLIKHFNKTEDIQQVFIKKILNEFNRLLNKKNGLAILLINSSQMQLFEKNLDTFNFKLDSKWHVCLGETNAYIVKLKQI